MKNTYIEFFHYKPYAIDFKFNFVKVINYITSFSRFNAHKLIIVAKSVRDLNYVRHGSFPLFYLWLLYQYLKVDGKSKTMGSKKINNSITNGRDVLFTVKNITVVHYKFKFCKP